MAPPRLIGILLLVAGIVLLVMGLRAMDSFGSQFHEFFTGSPTDRAVWMTIGGIAALVVGSGLALVPGRSASR